MKFPSAVPSARPSGHRLLALALLILVLTGLNPFLRLVVYERLSLKGFIEGMNLLSLAVLLVEACILISFKRLLEPEIPWKLRWSWSHAAIALLLYPVLWIAMSLVLLVLTDAGFLQESARVSLYDSSLYIRQHPWSLVSLCLLLSGVLEELIYRGLLLKFLMLFVRPVAAVILGAFLYSLAHISWQSSSQSYAALFLFALALSYIRLRYGIAAAVLVHLINNVLVNLNQVWEFNAFRWSIESLPKRIVLGGFLLAGTWFLARDLWRAGRSLIIPLDQTPRT